MNLHCNRWWKWIYSSDHIHGLYSAYTVGLQHVWLKFNFSEYGKSIVMPLEHHTVLNSGCCWIRSILLSTSPAYQDFIYVSLLHLKSLCNISFKPQKFYVDIWWIVFSFLALIPSLCTWHAGTKSVPLWTYN